MLRVPLAAMLAWIVPGGGHLYIGERVRGLIFLVTITLTFWTGIAVGGTSSTVNPYEQRFWFLAQLCGGWNTLAVYGYSTATEQYQFVERVDSYGQSHTVYSGTKQIPHWVSSDVGLHYTGVAGLLNLLVILDVILRADPRSMIPRDAVAREGGRASP